jgi:SAM-dependent methyltransferase
MASNSSEAHWDSVYGARHGIVAASHDDPIAAAALTHFGDVRGRRILDVGCGGGEYSLLFAGDGADVVSIDTSAQAIERLQDHCTQNNVTNVHAERMSAFDIETLGRFDLVFGSYVLHHLEPFDEFASLLRRVVLPGGRGFFQENNAMSDILIWCRDHLVGHYGIPKFGDDEEFPLTPSEVNVLRRHFDVQVTYPEFLFARLGTRYLLKGRGAATAQRVDEYLYRFPRIRRYSYRQFLYLS